jgi:hypothetical protein
MNIVDWKPFYKINPDDGNLIETNLIYTPLVSPDDKIFCMNFDHSHAYQNQELSHWLPSRPYYTKEMVEFFFNRELKYFSVFSNRSWAPKVIEIDAENQRIFFEWTGETCNQIIYSGRKIEDYCPTWKVQMLEILKDITHSGYYKTSLYPHCYYIDQGILKTFDFYGCVERKDPYVSITDIKGMIGETSGPRFEAAVKDNMLNVEILFKDALKTWIKWPDDVLPMFYQELFDE